MACATQDEIAEVVGCAKSVVNEVCSEKFRETESNKPAANHLTDFDPPIYNTWKQQTPSAPVGVNDSFTFG